jgi:glycosyltransferase involved in cell wall biosynthesis
MLSIVIPTLNEEEYLPGLLNSIKEQNFNDLEIIVSDAGSKDKTVKIAKNYGCKVVKGGLPSIGKNNGAKVAKGDIIVFLDADMRLSKGELKDALEEFKSRKLDLASSQLRALEKDFFGEVVLHLFYNFPMVLFEKILPRGVGFIMVKKDFFGNLKGFDEKVILAEDTDFIRQAVKMGEFGILERVKPFYSLRRFKKEGWVVAYVKYFISELYFLIFGPDRKQKIKFQFGHHKRKKDYAKRRN